MVVFGVVVKVGGGGGRGWGGGGGGGCVFFFQAEDGIRDIGVTGVQTCALPILAAFHSTMVLGLFGSANDLRCHLRAHECTAASYSYRIRLDVLLLVLDPSTTTSNQSIKICHLPLYSHDMTNPA